ncbi:MAG: hypothetical protein WC205_19555 [Opitutaceae bacterium]|jgi:hypothetical protein
MKKTLLVSALLFVSGLCIQAETVHQTAPGSAAYKGDGSNAVKSGLMETKTIKDISLARVAGSMNQWGYVTYWMGLRTPPGASVIRVRVFNTGEPTAGYAVYISGGSKESLGMLDIPAGSPANSFINIDVPVSLEKEWSGIIIKKATKDQLPGPWIESISVLLN